MKKALVFLFLLSTVAHADSIPVGCIGALYHCWTIPDQSEKCFWDYEGSGQVRTVDLQKTGTGPNYEIWEGNSKGVQSGIPFQLAVYQRREGKQNINYLTVKFTGNDTTVSAIGKDLVQAMYLKESDKQGSSIRCDSDIHP